MSIEKFKSQLDNYYISRLKKVIKEGSNNSKTYPLTLAVSYAIKEFLISENFKISDLNLVYVRNDHIIFEYISNLYIEKNYIRVYLNTDMSIDTIEFVIKKDIPAKDSIGCFIEDYTAKLYKAIKNINLHIDYSLDIGRFTIGAKILKGEDNNIFELFNEYHEIYHYIRYDESLSKNIGIIIRFSIVKGEKEKEE